MKIRVATTLVLLLVLASCATATDSAQDISLVSASDAAGVIADAPTGLVVLDIRTPEEFAGPRLGEAVNVDFYAADFATQLDELDKSVPYVVYCRSGNRTSQAIPIMRDLGFEVVYEVDGGIVSWAGAGLPLDQ